MGSGGTSKSTQQSKTEPWAAQQPYLREIYSLAQNLFGQGEYQYGPDQVADRDSTTVAGEEMARLRALQGSPLLRSAQGAVSDTLSGRYMDPSSNPWLSKSYDAAARGVTRNFQESVMPTLNSRFAMGRTQQDAGGSAQTAAVGRAQGELATGLGDLATNIYGGAYQTERGLMAQAASAAPTLAAADYADSEMLRGIGQERQGQAQRVLDDIVNRFNFEQFAPAQKLAEYSGLLGAPVSATESSGKSKSSNVSVLWG